MTQLKYPPLPEPFIRHYHASMFSVEHMYSYADAAIARDRQMWYDPTGASNYGEILNLLGMEEEGDPVADVKRLLLTHEAHSRCTKVKTDQTQADAALAQQAARHAAELKAYELTVSNRDAEIANLRGTLATHAAHGLSVAFDGLGAGRKALKHDFFRPGDADCPDEIKAPNGELHTLFCRNCGDYWRNSREACLPAAPAPERKPAHTEAEVQEILACVEKHLWAFSEPVVRRILGVPAPEDK